MLTGKNKRQLRALANGLKPITQVGKDGISDGLYKSINDAFNTRELIKVNVLKTCDVDLDEIVNSVIEKCDCEHVQTIGKTLVFYKKAKDAKIILD